MRVYFSGFNLEKLDFFDLFVPRDILLGLMKRLVSLRQLNLKVLITSATLDGVKVSKFFSSCPVLNVPGTLYPVEQFYGKEHPTNYIESSLKTALGMTHKLNCHYSFTYVTIFSVLIEEENFF